MTDHGLDRTPHRAPARRSDANQLARGPDTELLPMIVTAIARVDRDAARLRSGEALEASDQRRNNLYAKASPSSVGAADFDPIPRAVN